MSLNLTDRTQQVLQKREIRPQLVLEIDGLDTIYSAMTIQEIIRIGDPGLLIGGGWVIGGLKDILGQSSLISFDGTTTDISQQLSPDKAAVSSISSMKIALVDKDEEITRLITPGEVVEDILGRRARVWLGFEDTAYPQDFITIFRGIIDDIVSDQGLVTLNLAHPDQKKRNTIFERGETALNGAINNSVTTIPVDDSTNFLIGILGPDGSYDTAFRSYVRIDDEVIQYTGKTLGTFTGCTRGALGTIAVSHDDDADVISFYVLEENGVKLALKLMLSGWEGPFQEDVAITNFNDANGVPVTNGIYFRGVNVREKYGVAEGDFITSTGSAFGANNVSLKPILSIESTSDGGTYIVVDDVSFVGELDSAAEIAFRSQYDTLPSGLKMHGDEVDIDGHLLWYNRYLSSFDYRFYVKDTVEGREFIEKKIYVPMAAYALPRKSRASMGFHSGPIPSESLITIDDTNCTDAKKLKLRRTVGKNFYNTVVHRFDEDVLEERFKFGNVSKHAESQSRINVGKTFLIDAHGMRRNLQGVPNAQSAALSILSRYKFGAEFIEDVPIKFAVGFKVEVGDVVIFDGTNLNVTDTVAGVRGMPPRLFEVVNKKINIKTGLISLSLVDTNISLSNRYGLISPASYVSAGVNQTEFSITASFSRTYGVNEYRKWQRYIGCSVKVRNSDFSVSGVAILERVNSDNSIRLATALGFVPAADYIMELSEYNDQNATIKLLYTFMTDAAAFDDGKEPYKMI